MRSKLFIPLLQAIRGEGRGRRLLDMIHPHNHTPNHYREIWRALGILVRDLPSRRRALLIHLHVEYLQSRAQSSHPHPVYHGYTHPGPSPSPAPSSSSSRLAQSRARRQTEGIAPQPMRHSFTHPGGWPDRLQRARTAVVHPQASRSTSHLASHLDSGPSQPRRGKRKRPTGSESGISAPPPVAAPRDTGGPQRSHRRHYNIAEKTQSTMLPSGGMYMTFPLDIPSPEPETEGRAGPPPFEHGPTELPPRAYETQVAEREGSGPERPAKRGRLPADVMDHASGLQSLLAIRSNSQYLG